MRTLITLFVFISATVYGQQSSSTIIIEDKIGTIIERKKEFNRLEFETQYYAIQLYYGNYTAAKRLAESFKKDYPTWEANVDFDSPNYKVRVGRFKELSLAQQKLEEIRKEYPSAFLLEPNNL